MLLSELIALPQLGLRVLVGMRDTRRTVRSVYITDLPEPGRFLRGGEFVLTGMMWRSTAADSDPYVRTLIAAGAAALGAGTAIGAVPADLVAACERHGLVLVEVPEEVSFTRVTEEAQHLLRTGPARDRGRGVIAELAAGADFATVFGTAAREAGLAAWVISSTARTIAHTGEELAPRDAGRLAGRYVRDGGRTLRAQLPDSGEDVTLLPVRTRTTHTLTSWFLAVRGTSRDWTPAAAATVEDLLSAAVLARSRLEDAARAEARHAGSLPRLVDAQQVDDSMEILDAAGVARSSAHAVVSARMLGAARPTELPRQLLAEMLPPGSSRVVCGGAEAVAVVALDRADDAAEELAASLREAARPLTEGLTRHRLALGVSRTVGEPASLRRGLVESRHARQLAESRTGRIEVVAGAEIDSHELLLAAVPVEVRSSYTERLLGPVVSYDAEHRSELVTTLERFLEHSGSWQRCAAAMHVHVNTLRYRVGRIEELTGRDLRSLEHRVDLFLALRLRREDTAARRPATGAPGQRGDAT
ncbi:PucR family transcriptional regulator [Spiractinospora alimapuensis]|uniref:PucR family transcriptional regulator n=1 Tax=Spiractinospora alimapuensis TaxID=2820884 RepID=UPI001F48C270|nr:PucR family transcriptional regulator [Spiractinospora alimapuensis]QVQ52866.1 PucR family transcriptional regulator [Spiractinospora alimapuensis]